MQSKAVSGTMLTLLLIGMSTLVLNIQQAKAVPDVILSDKEIIPNPENTSSIAFNATVETPMTHNIWFQIKAVLNETGLRFSESINVPLENSTRFTVEWVSPYDPRFDKLPALNGTTIYWVDPYSSYNWPSTWVYGITTVYDDWEHALTGYLSEIKPDSLGPAIRILSPRWEEYTTTDFPLIFTVDEPTDWIGYSLDGQANVTITGNTTLTDLSIGWHDVMVYANDTSGNMGFSDPSSADWVHFTVSELALGVIIESNVNISQKYVTRNTMYFNVSGPAGTLGYINVTFPKINTTNLQVFIDNEAVAVIITANASHYFIYFEFTLSTHTIATQFATEPDGGISVPVNKISLLAPYIGLAVLLAIAVVTVGYIKKRKGNTEINS